MPLLNNVYIKIDKTTLNLTQAILILNKIAFKELKNS